MTRQYSSYLVGERNLATSSLLKEIMSNSMCIAVVSIPNVKVLTKSTL